MTMGLGMFGRLGRFVRGRRRRGKGDLHGVKKLRICYMYLCLSKYLSLSIYIYIK
jgi:hypothetical protein